MPRDDPEVDRLRRHPVRPHRRHRHPLPGVVLRHHHLISDLAGNLRDPTLPIGKRLQPEKRWEVDDGAHHELVNHNHRRDARAHPRAFRQEIPRGFHQPIVQSVLKRAHVRESQREETKHPSLVNLVKPLTFQERLHRDVRRHALPHGRHQRGRERVPDERGEVRRVRRRLGPVGEAASKRVVRHHVDPAGARVPQRIRGGYRGRLKQLVVVLDGRELARTAGLATGRGCRSFGE